MDKINIINNLQLEINNQIELLNKIEVQISMSYYFLYSYDTLIELYNIRDNIKKSIRKMTLYKMVNLKKVEIEILYSLIRRLDN